MRYSRPSCPRRGLAAIGVLLQDPARTGFHIRLRRDWDEVAGEDAELFEALEDDLDAKAAEWGAEKLFGWLEDTLSNTVRITDRESVLVRDFEQTLNRLYSRHVQSTVPAGPMSRDGHCASPPDTFSTMPRWNRRASKRRRRTCGG